MITENFPPFAGKFPHGVQCPKTCKYYMYPTTRPILNYIPSGTWLLENVTIIVPHTEHDMPQKMMALLHLAQLNANQTFSDAS